MSFKAIGFAAVLGAATFAATAASATVTGYSDGATWAAAFGGPYSTNFTVPSGLLNQTISSITLSDGTTIDLQNGATVNVSQPGNNWGTWSGWTGNYTGAVYWSASALTLDFSLTPVVAFGFEIQPNFVFTGSINISMTLDDGTQVDQSFSSISDTKFYGWIGTGVQSVTISGEDDFGIGNFVSAKERTTDAPEPATLSLIGAGVLGMGALRRRKAKA